MQSHQKRKIVCAKIHPDQLTSGGDEDVTLTKRTNAVQENSTHTFPGPGGITHKELSILRQQGLDTLLPNNTTLRNRAAPEAFQKFRFVPFLRITNRPFVWTHTGILRCPVTWSEWSA